MRSSGKAPGHGTAGVDWAAVLPQVLAGWPAVPASLLQVLIALQAAAGWLPRPALAAVARALGTTPAEAEGVAGFYRFLHLAPVGRFRLLFADNITDRFAGSEALLADLCGRLGVRPGEVRADGRVSLERTSCTGLGDQGPALLVNHDQVVTRLDAARIAAIAERVEADLPPEQWPAEWQQVLPQVRRADILLGTRLVPGEALAAGRARGPEGVVYELRASRLRGRGGAGFTTGEKWALARAAGGEVRHVVCNADEGEPGTFKDRVLLSEQADAVFEGMTLAALAIGARHGWLYLRGEYRFLLPALEAVLARRRAAGLLGEGIAGQPGFDFDIRIHLGAGAYVCGEETALIESLEGKRGTPRARPPFPVQAGLFGAPTLVNNVETFCAATHIALQGGAWWSSIGTARSAGTKLHAVSGDCARPGVYEYPFGTTVARILEDCGATDTQAVQVGGPSGSCVSAMEFGRRIGFEDLPTAGAFMVFDRSRDMFAVARNFAGFFAHESCGFCTPCRVGTALTVRRLDKLAAGRGSRHDLAALGELDTLLHAASHCGLGATATRPVHDMLQRFRPAFERRLGSLHFEPAFDPDAELSGARAATGRDDAAAHLTQHAK